MTIRLQLISGFTILILLFIVAYLVTQKLSNEVLSNTSEISKSENIIRNSNLLQKNIIEMQSGFRGFLLTGQNVFLEPYYKGLRNVPALMTQMRKLTEQKRQQLLLDSIENLHKEWIDYSSLLIVNRLDTTQNAILLYKELFEKKLRMEVGKKLNDQIELLFYDFNSYEYSVRHERRQALQESIEATRRITLLLTLFSILIGMLSGWYLVRTITTRITKMVKLAERISKGNFQTIDDRKKDELRELSESLNSMSQTLEKNFRELTQKNKELDQFAYVVSHDLKAPLRGISNITSWIEEDHSHELTPEVKYNLDLIKGRTVRLENMINGLLDYARIGKIKREAERVDILSLLRDLGELLVPKSFHFIIEEPMPIIYTERLLIEQVFSNLISNAVKYNNKQQGEIKIAAKEYPEHYKFWVGDNGPGIQEEYHEKVFMIFQTLQERDAFESTGVGLAIVKKIIEDQKASIHIAPGNGNGTTFVFTWPKFLPK